MRTFAYVVDATATMEGASAVDNFRYTWQALKREPPAPGLFCFASPGPPAIRAVNGWKLGDMPAGFSVSRLFRALQFPDSPMDAATRLMLAQAQVHGPAVAIHLPSSNKPLGQWLVFGVAPEAV